MTEPSALTALRRDAGTVARDAWVWLVAAAVAAGAFVAVVPPGLPYDEPAHWATVEFYADEARMPELGEPGATYEAQMGPVAYVVAAAVATPVRALAGDVAAFHAVRALGALELLALVLLLGVAARRAVDHRSAAVLAVAVAGLNPMLLAVGASVQNDILAIALGLAAILIAVDPARPRTLTHVIVGMLLGLAILTKVTAWPFAVAVAVVVAIRRDWRGVATIAGTAIAVSGWWFVRNLALYGDVTGRAGVEAAGYEFPALGEVGVAGLAKSAVTYLWLPTEYVRNTIEAPPAVDALVLALTLAIAAGAWLAVRRAPRPPALLITLAAVAAGAVAAWAFVAITAQAVAFRTAYASLPFVHACLGALAMTRRRWPSIALLVAVGALTAWFLVEVATLDGVPELIELS